MSHIIEYEKDYCETLKWNRLDWNVICGEIKEFDGWSFRYQIDLLAGGAPWIVFIISLFMN